MGKAVGLLGEVDSRFAGLTGDVLMTVEHHLGGERRVTAHLDGDVAPIGIQDVKGVVVYVGHRSLALEVMVGADVPHRHPSAADQNQKQPAGDFGLGQVLLGKIVLALPDRTVDDRYAMCFGIAAYSTAETACHSHQVDGAET